DAALPRRIDGAVRVHGRLQPADRRRGIAVGRSGSPCRSEPRERGGETPGGTAARRPRAAQRGCEIALPIGAQDAPDPARPFWSRGPGTWALRLPRSLRRRKRAVDDLRLLRERGAGRDLSERLSR